MSSTLRVVLMAVGIPCLTSSSFVWAQSPGLITDPHEFIQRFCEVEFNAYVNEREKNTGIERRDFVMFSPKRAAEEKKRDPDFGGEAIDLYTPDIFIVDSFNVIGVHVMGKDVMAQVIFRRIAKVTEKDSVIEDFKQNDTVEFHLIKKKSRWWVLDPPMPRVSIDVVIKGYENAYPTGWINHGNLTEFQKAGYYHDQSKLSMLKFLRSKYISNNP